MGESLAPLLELDRINKRFGKTVVAEEFSLSVASGEFFTFLGPSGSGKSTILRMVAGLDAPDRGRILVNGTDVKDTPSWRRDMGMVFQDYAIFPHMNVAENVSYGMKVRGTGGPSIKKRVQELLQLVGLSGMEKKNVTVLSGGERQRVAIARALAPDPSLLLLDEPMAALDEKIRREMQTELKQIQRRTGTTFLYVTHDQEEALTMSDRIAVINMGRCVQCDLPETVFKKPKTKFVADFFRGCNVITGDLLGVDGSAATVGLADTRLRVKSEQIDEDRGETIDIAIRAENVAIGTRVDNCEVRFNAILQDVVYRGSNVDHLLQLADGQELVATSTNREESDVGGTVRVGISVDDVVLLAG